MDETYNDKMLRELPGRVWSLEADVGSINAKITELQQGMKRLAELQEIVSAKTPAALALEGIIPGQLWIRNPDPNIRHWLESVTIKDLLTHRQVKIMRHTADGKHKTAVMKAYYLRRNFHLEK